MMSKETNERLKKNSFFFWMRLLPTRQTFQGLGVMENVWQWGLQKAALLTLVLCTANAFTAPSVAAGVCTPRCSYMFLRIFIFIEMKLLLHQVAISFSRYQLQTYTFHLHIYTCCAQHGYLVMVCSHICA